MTPGALKGQLVVLCIGLLLSGSPHAETVGRVVGITDGDTFTLLTEEHEQLRIRVAEIDAPERGQPYANRSREALAALVFGKDVRVEVQVVDNFGRLVGRPFVGQTDVCAEMISSPCTCWSGWPGPCRTASGVFPNTTGTRRGSGVTARRRDTPRRATPSRSYAAPRPTAEKW